MNKVKEIVGSLLIVLAFCNSIDAIDKSTKFSPDSVATDDGGESLELFDLMFSEAKIFYMDAQIAAFFGDTAEAKYCFDRCFEVIAGISDLDTLTLLQQDDFDRFYKKITFDFQNDFSYLNGDSGIYQIDFIQDELSASVFDTVALAHDTLVIVDDRPGHLPLVRSRKVNRIIDYYSIREHDRFQEWLDNSGLYREHMVKILKKYGLPEELFYLALIESGFNPVAYSYAHAVGPWQFITSTGALYGLKRNWWIDERRDPIKSTEAAARYLRKLYDEFNDWFLALAAYNTGELRVWRAIQREGTRDYWKLRSLPRQTRNYIPTLMAAITIALNPEDYGFERKPHDTWQWDEVIVDRSYEFEDIARVCGISSNILKQYNPELRRWITPPDMNNYTLRVPLGKGSELQQKLADLPEAEKKPEMITHTVRRGQTISYIAQKYRISVSALVTANNITNINQLRVGQVLNIPVNDYYASAVVTSDQDIVFHRVKRGETLTQIAQMYGTSVSKLRSLNNLYGKRYIYAGQNLRIQSKKNPAPFTDAQAAKSTKIIHVVKKGETLSEIAEAYKVGLSNIRAWNNLYGTRFIYPGQKLVIYKSQES
jgi:membrane-bound lytic murein transglycosylase D